VNEKEQLEKGLEEEEEEKIMSDLDVRTRPRRGGFWSKPGTRSKR
jgi:hypothetical protein